MTGGTEEGAASRGAAGGDAELERLKAMRLAEMRRNLQGAGGGAGGNGGGGAGGSPGSGSGNSGSSRPRRWTPREALVAVLGHRGTEVLEAAERQYPAQAPLVVDQLGRMVMAGELPGGLDGGGLLSVFRSIGIYVRLQTKIKVEQDGRLVPLADRLGRA